MATRSPAIRGPRRSADERRVDVIAAAIIEFATHGLYGASTERIAGRAGISQPYVLRLFGTKKALFLAAIDRVADDIVEVWATGLDAMRPGSREVASDEKLRVLGAQYVHLVRDVHCLRLVLQSFSSAEDPEIRDEVHRCMKRLYTWIATNTGASPGEIQQFWAHGMMLTVAASIQAADVAETELWARTFVHIPIEQSELVSTGS